MLYGGIPSVVNREDFNDKIAALENLFGEIYISDIYKRNKVRNQGELEDLLNILSSSIGSLTNPEKLKNTFRTVPASEKSEPRSECATIFRMGESDKTYTSLICRQTKTAMTDAGDNDTSVIRGRAIKKARG